MNQNRWNFRVAVLLGLASLLAGCLPSPAVTPLAPTAGLIPEVDEGELEILSPEESLRFDAETYAREYNIPVEEAIQRLRYQDQIGDLNAALEANEAGTFAGLWIEHEPKYKVVVLFTKRGKQTIRPYLEGNPLAKLVEIRRARYSLADLEGIYAQTTRELAKLDFDVTTMLDVKANRVEVMVSDRGWFEDELRRVGAKLPQGAELRVVEGGTTARNMDLLLTPPVAGIAFPRQKPVEGTSVCMAALMVGTLLREGECLYVQPIYASTRVIPIWPPDYTLRAAGDLVEVIDGNGQVAARVGEEVWMGGGHADVDEWVLQQIPPACRGDTFIACGGVRPNLKTDSQLFSIDILSVTPPGTVLFLRYTPALSDQVVDPVILSGTLVAYEYGRCLRLQTQSGERNLLWPPGWSARVEAGAVLVLDESGQEAARMGEAVRLRARTIPHTTDFPAYQQLINELPGDCMGGTWLVDGVD